MKIFEAILGLLFLVSAPAYGSTSCTSTYYQGCKSCAALKRITAKTGPDEGDYYRGAQWNGLYTAYVLNCMDIAKDLLRRGANPNWGGSQGSMIISVCDRWPHNSKKINRAWAKMLIHFGANAQSKVPEQGETPEQIVSGIGFSPDYPDLWRLFIR